MTIGIDLLVDLERRFHASKCDRIVQTLSSRGLNMSLFERIKCQESMNAVKLKRKLQIMRRERRVCEYLSRQEKKKCSFESCLIEFDEFRSWH